MQRFWVLAEFSIGLFHDDIITDINMISRPQGNGPGTASQQPGTLGTGGEREGLDRTVETGIAMGTGIRAGIVAVAALLATASFRADAQERHARVDTLKGGRIVVSNPDSPHAGPEGVPTLVEVLRIASIAGVCDSFGDVFSLAVDGDGRIYVADRQANEIRVFSARGECVGTFGRSGEGPGEFGMVAGIAWQPPGYLWAIDALRNRATVFDSLGTVLATHPLQLGRAASLPWRLWVDDGGSLHFWSPGFRRIVEYGTGPGLDSLAGVPQPTVPPEMRREGKDESVPIVYRMVVGAHPVGIRPLLAEVWLMLESPPAYSDDGEPMRLDFPPNPLLRRSLRSSGPRARLPCSAPAQKAGVLVTTSSATRA